MFFYDIKHIEVKHRGMLEDVRLCEIPYVRVENRFPAYDDWYAEEKEYSVIIYSRSSELFSAVKDGRGMTDYDYYRNYYLINNYSKYRRLLKREYTYELVKKFYDRLKNHNNVNINLLEIDIDIYRICEF